MQIKTKTIDPFKLSLVVAGFSKCGSTTLCSALAQHPGIAFSNPKELQFFNRADFEEHWDYYYAAFPAWNENQLFAEGSTFYSSYEWEKQARDALLRYFPDIKLIFIARDPFDRIESSYREFHHSGPSFGLDAPYGMANAIAAFPALLEDSKYWSRINCYREKIPDERILVVFFEDLICDHRKELQRCYAHLGIDKNLAAGVLPRLNGYETKYYDSKLLRHLRNTEIIGPLISKIPVDKQNEWFPKVNLRKKFRGQNQWDDASMRHAVKTLKEDICQFLSFYGKPENYWPRFTAEAHRVTV
jgi:hypothetical protein